MIVKNVPSELLFLEEPMCVFSDDSRFIYMLMCWLNPLSISVYDIVYNKFVTLLPDMGVTELLTRFDGFKEDTMLPSILYINNGTLLILFNEKHLGELRGSVLLTVVQLNFLNGTFSIVDNKIIGDCYSEPRLVKCDTRFLIVHTFAIETNEFISNDQFLAYFTFYLHDDQILEIEGNRIVFDFDCQNTGRLATWYACNNKLWCIRKVGRTMDNQLFYFNLNEKSPKEIPIKIFEESFEYFATQKCLMYMIKKFILER